MKRCPKCGYKELPPISRVRVKLGTQPAKREKGTYWRKGHEYLFGAKAHFERRIEIYRNAGGDIAVFEVTENIGLVDDLKPGMCQGCAETHPVGWYEGEWHHHVKTLGGKRCDCAACGLWVCADFHRRYHNRVIKSAKGGIA